MTEKDGRTHDMAEIDAVRPMATAAGGMELEPGRCGVCGSVEAEPVGVGEDFEVGGTGETFLAVRCDRCGLVYLDPRPTRDGHEQLARRTHRGGAHADDAQTRRLVADVPAGGTVVRIDRRAASDVGAPRIFAQVTVIEGGDIALDDLPAASVDRVLLVETLEDADDVGAVVAAATRILVPNGRLVVQTADTRSASFRVFGHRYWGAYDFPRRRFLFDAGSLRRLAHDHGLLVDEVRSIPAPQHWTRSVRNLAGDLPRVPRPLRSLGLEGARMPSVVFGAVEALCAPFGRAGTLQVTMRKPA